MFNLLPDAEKKHIFAEYRIRVGILVCLFLALTAALAFIFLVPSYLVSDSRYKEVSGRIDAVRHSTILREANELNTKLTSANLKIRTLATTSPQSAEALFERLLARRISSVRLSSLEYQRKAGGNELRFSGIAANRESLAQFVKLLESEPSFGRVNIPVSDFAKDRNASFSIQITVR
ncbi:hypothetical protein EPN83_03250 [Patescibacteria group bacterium]|nr:MAG: hypothetical protein EPN83_03250 [Patescibacteria group bacterium]